MRQLEVRLSGYEEKCLFAGFEIGFTLFAILFFEHLRLFYVDLTYGCQDTCLNVSSLVLKLGYWQ